MYNLVVYLYFRIDKRKSTVYSHSIYSLPMGINQNLNSSVLIFIFIV